MKGLRLGQTNGHNCTIRISCLVLLVNLVQLKLHHLFMFFYYYMLRTAQNNILCVLYHYSLNKVTYHYMMAFEPVHGGHVIVKMKPF